MAIDTTDKRRRLAALICAYAAQFRDTLNTLVNLGEQVADGGLTFVDSDFENQAGLKHTDAAKMSTFLANVGNLNEHIEDNFIDDVIEVVCP
jgi:flagellar motor component MotA